LLTSKISSILNPFCIAIKFAFSITGPSATGSEKGIPSSILSTPTSLSDNIASIVKFLSGKAVVKYATSFSSKSL